MLAERMLRLLIAFAAVANAVNTAHARHAVFVRILYLHSMSLLCGPILIL